jgi:hypothetical protein
MTGVRNRSGLHNFRIDSGFRLYSTTAFIELVAQAGALPCRAALRDAVRGVARPDWSFSGIV